LLLALAAPALVYGVRDAGAQQSKPKAQDENAQGEKDKDARKAKDKKDKDAQEEKDDDAQDANVEDKAETPVLIRPVPLMQTRPAPTAQGKPASSASSASAPASSSAPAPAMPPQGKPAPSAQTKSAPAAETGGAQPSAIHVSPVSSTQVSFKQLVKQAASAAQSSGPAHLMAIHAPLSIPDSPAPVANSKLPKMSVSTAPPAQNDTTGGPLVPSPAPSQNFLAQEDAPKVGGPQNGFFFIPPDTQGAVGLDKVFVNTNSNYRVQDKLTGAPLSTVPMDVFWNPSNSPANGSNFFDPRITFDPYNQRWILVADSNGQTTNSSIEVGLSDTADPQGTYHLYRFVVGCAAGTTNCVSTAGGETGEWADFPMLGFNKNWIAVSMNMFGIMSGGFDGGRVLVLDYPTLRTGTASGTIFVGASIGFCLHPVETYDPNQGTLFLAQHISSGGATYDLSTITGTPAAPVLAVGATKTRPGGGWVQPGGDILPQTCTGTAGVTCPNTLRFIDVGDAFVRGNAVFRNNHIYYTQTVGLPATGLTHTAAQWTELDTSGNFVDGGRIEDPTATSSNGGKWYAYSTIVANRNDDFLIGFSQFASNQFAAAGYAYHDHTDAAGTTRDPLIFKAGEDYYSKTFSGSRNRWGDYSHMLVDPVNDTDLWTIQEYAQLRTTPDANTVSNNSRWGTWWAKLAIANPGAAGDLVVSEFRLRGPGGANDEYVEIYNASSKDITVTTNDGSAGYGLFASDAALRFTIPNGTLIPTHGHYLGVGSAYSLGSYPAGVAPGATTATGDKTFSNDIPDNAGLALFNTSNPSNIATATRFDAVGSTSEANALFKEGTGYPAISTTNLDYAFVRDPCGKGGSIVTAGPCTTGGFPKDTNNNATDFFFVDTTGTDLGAGAHLGAPGPENSSSPVQRNNTVPLTLLDPSATAASAPNRVRDFDNSDATRAPLGHLTIRRTVTNNTGQTVTRLRFRIVDFTTFPAPAGTADLRAVTSGSVPATVTINGPNPACPANTCTVQQTTLETPPAQTVGGAFNSTLSVDTVTPTTTISTTPIPPGGTINVQFLLGIRQTGSFRILLNVEVLP
jgi:hypothetical protein